MKTLITNFLSNSLKNTKAGSNSGLSYVANTFLKRVPSLCKAFQLILTFRMLINEVAYSFYITTNSNRNVLYCGVTNDLTRRIIEHYLNRGCGKSFTGKYYCYWVIYYEDYKYVGDAISREKQIKNWNRKKKESLVNTFNPEWKFLNYEIFDCWPPEELFHRKYLI